MLDVVIVNWNAGDQLRQCVDSVLDCGNELVARVIVVDNGSTDGSADMVDGLPGITVIRTGENLGFAAACNFGAKAGQSPYVLFLNPDTRVEADSFSVPIGFMERAENARVGVCGIQLIDENGTVSRTCARFPTLGRLTVSAVGFDRLPVLRGKGMRMVEWNHVASRRVDQVMGAFFLIRRKVYEACDGFDERFFVYFEEVDLAYCAWNSGWESWYLTEARAFHAGGGTSRQVKARRLFYSLRSRLLYGFKHFRRWQAWLLVCLTGLIEPCTRVVWCVARGDVAGIRQTAVAYRMLWGSMGRIVRGEGRFEP